MTTDVRDEQVETADEHSSMTAKEYARSRRKSLIGAIFLMAISAIGPGFINSTAIFTAQLGSAFAFGILVTIIIDCAIQLNVWRMVTVTGKRASELANIALPGSGYVLSVLVIIGGLAFNIGNIAGAGLGLNALLGLDPKAGGIISAALALAIFLIRRAGLIMDRLFIVLGIVMIGLTVFVAVISNPPVGDALYQMVLPDTVDFATITTLVGGTVGGYITFAGAHRLLDSGVSGPERVKEVSKASINGILITGIMRFLLFLAFLGVVASGVLLDLSGNPAADAFEAAAGSVGMRIFGVVLWAAGITSVIGAAYTSITFTTVFSKKMGERRRNHATVGFIGISLLIYLALGTAPTALLIFAGGFNGLILPIGLSIFMYMGWFRGDLMNGYRFPRWLLVIGTLVTILTWYMAYKSFMPIIGFLSL